MKRLAIALLLAAAPATAQDQAPAAAAPEPDSVPTYPFAVGERFDYQVKLGIFSVGRARLQVLQQDTMGGRDVFMLRMSINGRALFFTLDDTLTSWTGVRDFRSYRFLQTNNEDGKYRKWDYYIHPDSGYYRKFSRMDTTYTTVADPLDDVAFLYWVRTLPLVVGQSYTWDRYFRPDRNPVRVRVLKRQNCELPNDEKRKCLLVQPSIRSNGLLGEAADARILITDDVDRIPVEVRSNFSFGTLVLKLRRVTRGGAPVPVPAAVPPAAGAP